jgi:hypothetical protein
VTCPPFCTWRAKPIEAAASGKAFRGFASRTDAATGIHPSEAVEKSRQVGLRCHGPERLHSEIRDIPTLIRRIKCVGVVEGGRRRSSPRSVRARREARCSLGSERRARSAEPGDKMTTESPPLERRSKDEPPFQQALATRSLVRPIGGSAAPWTPAARDADAGLSKTLPRVAARGFTTAPNTTIVAPRSPKPPRRGRTGPRALRLRSRDPAYRYRRRPLWHAPRGCHALVRWPVRPLSSSWQR